MGMFYVYLLHSIADDGLYIGYSTDLKRRLSEHKRGPRLQQGTAGRGSSSIMKLTWNEPMPKGENDI